MFLLQSPQPTRFDLNFTLAGIPVRVHPLFWVLALFLGIGSGNIIQILIWLGVVFISILVHELGHALAFRRYDVDSYIVLHMMGGLTIPVSTPYGGGGAKTAPSPGQQIMISLAGPFAGFVLAGLIVGGVFFSGGAISLLPFSIFIPFGGQLLWLIVTLFLWVNIFWGLVNLLPVFPLDGGQVARNILIQYDPFDGARKSLWLSTITGVVVGLAALYLLGSVYMAILFGFLALQSYQAIGARY
ncbi:MAG: site-2 protease family protein [Anaerolineales bacterium]|nr:site-2 protease family protein [Anaerolineales bacterium]